MTFHCQKFGGSRFSEYIYDKIIQHMPETARFYGIIIEMFAKLKGYDLTYTTKSSTIMTPMIKRLSVLDDYILFVEFDDGYKVMYDVKDDINTLPSFRALVDVYGLFKQARLDSSRTCVYWNDQIDLASDSIYEYGKAA